MMEEKEYKEFYPVSDMIDWLRTVPPFVNRTVIADKPKLRVTAVREYLDSTPSLRVYSLFWGAQIHQGFVMLESLLTTLRTQQHVWNVMLEHRVMQEKHAMDMPLVLQTDTPAGQALRKELNHIFQYQQGEERLDTLYKLAMRTFIDPNLLEDLS